MFWEAVVENNSFQSELEIFRTEEEIAQQYFAYLSVRSLAAEDKDVLNMMNENSLFWITVHHAMLLSTFMALGRIFDQQSAHNVDALMSATSAALKAGAFSIVAGGTQETRRVGDQASGRVCYRCA